MNTCHLNNADDNLLPAAKQPCKECPARLSNSDTPAPNDWFTQDNFERMWASMARENRVLPCHLFDTPERTGYDARSEEAGLVKPVELGKPKECAGMSAMVHRETRIAAQYPDWETYIADRPTGLQRAAYETALARLSGVGTPLTEPANLDDPELIDPAQRVDLESMAWTLGDAGTTSLLATLQEIVSDLNLPVPSCECPVCEGHASVHEPKTFTLSTGETVEADAELVPLLEALSGAGVRTTASCKDLHGAMERLWPEQIPVLLAEDNPRTISYAAPLRRKEAVVRFENRNAAARGFVMAVRFQDGLHLSDGTTQAQISFPLSMVSELTALVERAR